MSVEDSRLRAAFLFKGGRISRLALPDPAPREFFYGATEIECLDMIEENEFAAPSLAWSRLGVDAVVSRLAGLNAGQIASLSRPGVLSRLNAYDVVAAATNLHGLTLALLRALGLLRAKVLFIPMGVLALSHSLWRRALYRRLLRFAALAPLSLAEEDYLRKHLDPGQDIEYLPFGVDTDFWSPGPDGGEDGGYVLSIGNDWNRDYALLASAWQSGYPPLKVVTSLPMPPVPDNVSIIKGGWNKQILSDADVRGLYRGARFVILPLCQTIQPAGQSACLQAMACGKAVIISDIIGLWDRGLMIDGKTCLLSPPGSADELKKRIEKLLNDPKLAREIGRKAGQTIAKSFNLGIMAGALEKRINALGAQKA